MSSLILVYTIHCIYYSSLYGFSFLCLTVLENLFFEMFENWRERNTRAVRGPDYSPAIVLSEEKDKFVTENWRKKKNGPIKRQIDSSSLIPVYTIHAPIVHMCTKFQISRPHSSWDKCDKNYKCLIIGEKEKWKNKGTNTQQPDSGIHDTATHCQQVYQV